MTERLTEIYNQMLLHMIEYSFELAFLDDEVDKINTQIWYTIRAYKREWPKIRNLLSFFDLFQFCRYLSQMDQRTENAIKEKYKRNIQLLRKKRFGGMLIYKKSIS